MKRHFSISFEYALLLLLTLCYLLGRFDWISIPVIIHGYLGDLVCIPIMLIAARWLMAQFYRKPDFQLSTTMIAIATGYTAIVFEWLLPSYSEAYIADIWDVLCYGLGGLYYALRLRRGGDLMPKLIS